MEIMGPLPAPRLPNLCSRKFSKVFDRGDMESRITPRILQPQNSRGTHALETVGSNHSIGMVRFAPRREASDFCFRVPKTAPSSAMVAEFGVDVSWILFGSTCKRANGAEARAWRARGGACQYFDGACQYFDGACSREIPERNFKTSHFLRNLGMARSIF